MPHKPETSLFNRWAAHWRALPTRNRAGAALCLVVLIILGFALAYHIGSLLADVSKIGQPSDPAAGQIGQTSSPAAVQDRVWSKAQPLLKEANRKAAQALNKHLASIHGFLNERKAGSKAFAEKMLTLQGKWNLVLGTIGDNSAYTSFLQQAFRQYLFPMPELEKTVNTAIRGYLAELEAIDDDLLVRLRADLADDELPRMTIPALRSEDAWRSHYHELSQRVAQDLRTDLAVIAGRELFLWEAQNIATDLTVQAGAAIATRLGLSSAILTTGAASAWETFGVGLVVSLVLDEVVCRLIKAAGYDAETNIARRVEEMLSDLGRTITDGDPTARLTLKTLKQMQQDDPKLEIRIACAEAIRSIETGTQLYGLRRDLANIADARASLRNETMRRLVHQSE